MKENELSQLSPRRREAFQAVLSLWDAGTKDLERLYGFLMEGKSELAAVMLESYRGLHNTQSRAFLYGRLVVLALDELRVGQKKEPGTTELVERPVEGRVVRVPRVTKTVRKRKGSRPYGGIFCDICGMRVSHPEKGTHIANAHPEYSISKKWVEVGGHGGQGRFMYTCGFCDAADASPARAVEHIRKVHPEILSSILECEKDRIRQEAREEEAKSVVEA